MQIALLMVILLLLSALVCRCAAQCVSKCDTMASGTYSRCLIVTDSALNGVLNQTEVMCFGYNYLGNIGNRSTHGTLSTTTASFMPSTPLDFGGARIVHIAMGNGHTCVLTGEGWLDSEIITALGYTEGFVPHEPYTTNVQLTEDDQKATYITAGTFHTCVLLESGRVRCFGNNSNSGAAWGAIGSLDPLETFSPPHLHNADLQMPDDLRVIQMCAGALFNCFVLENGRVACNGRNEQGQLGNTNAATAPQPVLVNLTTDPLLRATDVACGALHVCAILENGRLKCWGFNNHGQLGYNNVTRQSSVVPREPVYYSPANGHEEFVDFGLNGTERVIKVTCGFYHTCALLDADTSNAYCWGRGTDGQLGYGDSDSVAGHGAAYTVASRGPVNTGTARIQEVSASAYTTCLKASSDLVGCQGSGQYGLLGNNDLSNIGVTNTIVEEQSYVELGSYLLSNQCFEWNFAIGQVDTLTITCPWEYTVRATCAGGREPSASGACVQRLAAGTTHSCAVDASGELACWGAAVSGTGSSYGASSQFEASPMPPPRLEFGGEEVVQIDSYSVHSCVITSGANLRCFGNDTLSRGFLANFTNYEALGGPFTGNILVSNVQSVKAIGVAVTPISSCFLLNNGRVYCVGQNLFGRLGFLSNFTLKRDHIVAEDYVRFPNNERVTQICAGAAHCCARTEQGNVACWGLCSSGQCGVGASTSSIWNPAEFPYIEMSYNSSLKADFVACGLYSTCVIMSNGKLKCFGANHVGSRLGLPYAVNVGLFQTPAYYSKVNGYQEFVQFKEDGSGRVVDVDVGSGATCALLDTGEMYCFGNNGVWGMGYGDRGQVGGVSYPQPFEKGPVPMPNNESVIAIDAKTEHFCAMVESGSIYCFGGDSYGKLGTGQMGIIGADENLAEANLPVLLSTPSPTQSPTQSPTPSPSESPPLVATTTMPMTQPFNDQKSQPDNISSNLFLILFLAGFGLLAPLCVFAVYYAYMGRRRRLRALAEQPASRQLQRRQSSRSNLQQNALPSIVTGVDGNATSSSGGSGGGGRRSRRSKRASVALRSPRRDTGANGNGSTTRSPFEMHTNKDSQYGGLNQLGFGQGANLYDRVESSGGGGGGGGGGTYDRVGTRVASSRSVATALTTEDANVYGLVTPLRNGASSSAAAPAAYESVPSNCDAVYDVVSDPPQTTSAVNAGVSGAGAGAGAGGNVYGQLSASVVSGGNRAAKQDIVYENFNTELTTASDGSGTMYDSVTTHFKRPGVAPAGIYSAAPLKGPGVAPAGIYSDDQLLRTSEYEAVGASLR